MSAKPDTPMTGGVAELLAALLPISAPASGIAIPLGKRQRSATDVKVFLVDSFDYILNKLSKYTYTCDEVNTPLEKDIQAMVEEDNINTKAIMLNMLATIAGSLHTLSQAQLDMQVQLAAVYLKINSLTRNSAPNSTISNLEDKIDYMAATVSHNSAINQGTVLLKVTKAGPSGPNASKEPPQQLKQNRKSETNKTADTQQESILQKGKEWTKVKAKSKERKRSKSLSTILVPTYLRCFFVTHLSPTPLADREKAIAEISKIVAKILLQSG